MFDKPDFPYTQTFVREAIQNSLDARHDKDHPVRMRFAFHSEAIGPRRAFLEQLMAHRKNADLEIPPDWDDGQITWLLVEDSNTTGLQGKLDDRMGDFWNYWLNFGISNKDGSRRGGRGIGRVTFLIASSIKSVIGYTHRRGEDKLTAACGMTVLKAKKVGDTLRSTHAYLAKSETRDYYSLHDSDIFMNQIREAFCFSEFDEGDNFGLGLAILYPHKELNWERIMATAIEHFAPAILKGHLKIDVDGQSLNETSIYDLALMKSVADKIRDDAIKGDAERYLNLIEESMTDNKKYSIPITNANIKIFNDLQDQPVIKTIRKKIDEGQTCSFDFFFPMVKYGREEQGALTAIISKTPREQKPIDRFFREGMSLPDVTAKNRANMDLIILVDEGILATYLNFCEGKAHLDILESKEIREKLRKNGFEIRSLDVKRFIKNLPEKLRNLMQYNITEPDTTTFADFFSKPSQKPGRNRKPIEPNEPPDPPPLPQISRFKIRKDHDGLRITANPEHEDWPVTLVMEMAYANGDRALKWSKHDFLLETLPTTYEGCLVTQESNVIRAENCGSNTDIRIGGFDTNRELDTRTRVYRNATKN